MPLFPTITSEQRRRVITSAFAHPIGTAPHASGRSPSSRISSALDDEHITVHPVSTAPPSSDGGGATSPVPLPTASEVNAPVALPLTPQLHAAVPPSVVDVAPLECQQVGTTPNVTHLPSTADEEAVVETYPLGAALQQAAREMLMGEFSPEPASRGRLKRCLRELLHLQQHFQRTLEWHSLAAEAAGDWRTDRVLEELYDAEERLTKKLVQCMQMWQLLEFRRLQQHEVWF